MDQQVREQLATWIDELRVVGTFHEGGLWRQPFTEADSQAKDLLAQWMREAGLKAWCDNGGNVTGRLESEDGGSVIMTGSHLDSVKSGGYLDGTLGILAGLAVAAGLKRECGTPKRAIDVVALCGEEQSRFRLPFIGSRSILGNIAEQELYDIKDSAGISVAEAMTEVGLDPKGIASAKRDDIAYFIEIHIEQGPVLEAKGIKAGIVTDIVGITQKSYTIFGDADHGGTTPMTMRHDALRAAVKVIDRVPEICQSHGESCVATVGVVGVKPGGVSSVPAEFTFTLDVRDRTVEVRQAILKQVNDLVEQVTRENDLTYTQVIHTEVDPAPMDPDLIDLFYREAEAAGISAQRMHSGAGHDAMEFARVVPCAMIFVPSKGGKSHTPKEHTDLDDIMNGIEILYRGIKRLAYD